MCMWKRGVLIALGSRCCRSHILPHGKNRLLQPTALDLLTIDNEVHLRPSEVQELLVGVRKEAAQQGLNWEDPSRLSDEDYWCVLGMQRQQLADLLKYVEEKIRLKGEHAVSAQR